MALQIVVALNGTRQRNLKMFAGDEQTLQVVVYAEDGTAVPLSVTSLTLETQPDGQTLPVGTEFTVPSDWPGRRWYRLRGEIAGVLTTICTGWLIIEGGDYSASGGNDYGWRWPFGGLSWSWP